MRRAFRAVRAWLRSVLRALVAPVEPIPSWFEVDGGWY